MGAGCGPPVRACGQQAGSLAAVSRALAALPVGAHSTDFLFCNLYISIMLFIIVVFPVPGPPVITHTLLSFTSSIASFCSSDRIISSTFSCFSISAFIFFIFLIILLKNQIIV